MPLRMAHYVLTLHLDLRRRRELGAAGQLPFVFPVVLSTADEPWTQALELEALQEEVPAELRPYCVRMRCALVDEAGVDPHELAEAGNLAAWVFVLKQVREAAELGWKFRALSAEVERLGEVGIHDTLLGWVLRYYLPLRFPRMEMPRVARLGLAQKQSGQ